MVLDMPVDDLQQYGEAKAREIQERRERRKAENAKAAGDTKLKLFWAPKLWEQIRDAIDQRVHAVNEALGENALVFDEGRADLVIVRVSHVTSNLSATYDSQTGRVTLSLDDHSERYDLDVAKGEVKFKAVGYFSPSQVAKMLVDKAAGMVV
jgi:hypothetical protein